MLKIGASEDSYSLTDSIRILQGQVNQMLSSLKKSTSENSKKLSNNNSFNTLKVLENRRSKHFNDFESEIRQNLVKMPNLQCELKANQGVVSYYNSQTQLFGIYADQDTILFFQEDQAYKNLVEAIENYRSCIEKDVKLDKSTIQKYLTSGHALYRTLINPFANRLAHIDQLVIIPDQLLDPIIFEALLSEEVKPTNYNFRNLPYLLKQAQIVYSPSWKMYRANQRKNQKQFTDQSIALWTNPKLLNSNGLEVLEQSIKVNFKNKYTLFNQTKNGKAHFFHNHHKFDILHLLLHASSSQVNRHNNQIQFGNKAEEILYGFDLNQQQFQSKLLVLSSCESATGTPQIGEGTFSLARSFINSGIPEVVAAQFLIPQTTTAPLLSYFYEFLAKGKTATSSLHLAKIKYLKNISSERHAYPRFWAGMVIFN